MSEKVIKSKNHEGWKWVDTQITRFSCHPEAVSELIENQQRLYSERGYEILDSAITEGNMFSSVELLLKPRMEKATKLLLDKAPFPIAKFESGSTSRAMTKLQDGISKISQ